MPAPKDLDPTASVTARLGYDLRKHRQKAGLTQTALAEKIGYSPSTVGSVERGQLTPSKDFLEACEKALGLLDGELLAHWPAISGAGRPKWFQAWQPHEEQAERLLTFAPLVVPGLLQTEEYARAILTGEPQTTPEQVDQTVALRMERQVIFNRPVPTQILAVIDEGVLSRPIGDEAITRRQIQHLIDLAELPHITIQLLPYDSYCTAGLLGPMVLAVKRGSIHAAYVESALEGRVVISPYELGQLTTRLDAIRQAALPAHLSIKRLRERVS